MVGEGVVGGMVVEVEVIGVVGVLGWLTVWERWRQRPYRSHIGRGLGVERSGGVSQSGNQPVVEEGRL